MIQLVIRAKSGDHEAFGELVEMHREQIFKMARQRLRDDNAADDVTQDVFVRAFRCIGRLENPEKFKGWLCQIVVRLSINYALRVKRLEGRDYFNPAGEEKDPAGGLIAHETALRVNKALKKIKRIYRAPIIDFYFQEMSLAEISEKYGIPLGTAKRRLYEGRKLLRNVFENRKEFHVL